MPEKGKFTYLGDGVYAMFDGYHFVLHTGSHDHPTNQVYLDEGVTSALIKFIESFDEKRKA